MKAFIRLFALLFSLAIIFGSIASCSGADKNDPFESTSAKKTSDVATSIIRTIGVATTETNVNTITTTSATTTMHRPPEPEVPESKLPSKNWSGEKFLVLGHSSDYNTGAEYRNSEICAAKDSDMVGSAIWYRNEQLKKKYNFNVEQELVPDTYSKAQTIYDAQDDMYDLVIYRPDKALAHATMGYLSDLNTLNYIDYSHPAWNPLVNNDLKINDALYFATSYFLLQDKKLTSVLIYNETLAEALNITGVKNLALEGGFTVEKFNEYLKLANTTIGKGANATKTIGVVFDSPEYFASFFYGAGAAITTNTNGKISLFDPKDASDLISPYCDALFDNTLSLIPSEPVNGANPDFYKGTSLFCATYFYRATLVNIGNMGATTCVLPLPKYDAKQDSYHCLVSPTLASVFAIPITVDDADKIAFFLQAISEESVDNSYSAYISMNLQYSDDESRYKLANLITKSQKFDIAATLNFGGVYTIISQTLPEFKTNVYERLYNLKEATPQTELDEFLNSFSES